MSDQFTGLPPSPTLPRPARRSPLLPIGFALLLLAMLVLRLTGPTSIAAYLLAAVYAWRSPRAAIEALFASWMATMLNDAIFAQVPGGAAMRALVLFSAAASLLAGRHGLRTTLSRSHATQFTLLLGFVLILHAFAVPALPSLSFLKTFLWLTGTLVLVAAWRRLERHEARQLLHHLFIALLAFIAISWPLVFTGAGFKINGYGFQGLSNHPQAYGLITGLVVVWAAAMAVRFDRKQPLYLAALVIAGPALVASEARTGVLAAMLALGLAAIAMLGASRERVFGDGRPPHLVGCLFMLLASLFLIVALWIDLPGMFVDVLTKRGSSGELGGAFEQSRGFLVDRMMTNIRREPWTGIGLGMPSQLGSLVVERDPFFGLPISAPIEKGVGPVAVVEELGIPLSLLLLGWIAFVIRRAWRVGLAALALSLYVLMTNIAEYTFFSLGGMGLLLMIIFTANITPGRKA